MLQCQSLTRRLGGLLRVTTRQADHVLTELWLMPMGGGRLILPEAWTAHPVQALQLTGFAKARRVVQTEGGVDDCSNVTVNLKDYEGSMGKSIDHLKSTLQGLRTGRASAGLLDVIRVEAYGDKIPLKGIASVSVRDRQTLAVAAYDDSIIGAIEKGIRLSSLSLNPTIQDKEILVHVPRLTKETLTAMQKLVKKEGESAKTTVRGVRREILDSVKKLASEDEQKRLEKQVQALTDNYVKMVDLVMSEKEAELSTAL